MRADGHDVEREAGAAGEALAWDQARGARRALPGGDRPAAEAEGGRDPAVAADLHAEAALAAQRRGRLDDERARGGGARGAGVAVGTGVLAGVGPA